MPGQSRHGARGTWGYRDPARIIADRFSAKGARTVVAQVGVLQQTLISRACTAISSGDLDVAIVCGGEARYREREASRTGVQASEVTQTGVEPDESLVPQGEIVAGLEVERGLAMPAHQYAVMENALRAKDGQDLAAHALAMADLWASFSSVASRNLDAWNRQEFTPSSLLENSPANRSIAFPYRRLHVSFNATNCTGVRASRLRARLRSPGPIWDLTTSPTSISTAAFPSRSASRLGNSGSGAPAIEH